MKKFFTLLTVACASIAAMGTDYNGRLMVVINGSASPSQEATISVNKQDNGKYTLELNNFMLGTGADAMGIGNIRLENTDATELNGQTGLNTTQNITITEGNDPNINFWMGPMLGIIPVSVDATMEEGKNLSASIDIPFLSMGMNIKVVFDSKTFHIGNSDFENFHTATLSSPFGGEPTTSDEPDYWHSFMSASGNPTMVYLAGYAPHTFISDIVRPGTTGEKSLLITSVDMGFTIANGTVTTGRINTGSTTAADLANYSWSDMSTTDKDDKGDPFYSLMGGRPDSLTIWAKFKQKEEKADFPYATINAVITDGTFYRDPEDKEYTNVIAKATNNTIESNNYEWQKITVPFIYEENGVNAKAIHVTISTNAAPGKGSTDSLYVDDLNLIYNCKLTDLTIKGKGIDLNSGTYNPADNSTAIQTDDCTGMEVTEDDIQATTNGKGAIVVKNITKETNKTYVTISVISNDLSSFNTYNLTLNGTTGIDTVDDSKADDSVKAMYDLNGQKTSTPRSGQIYIMKYNNGKTVKRIKN
ncbi:calycin-like domain-containing protein [Xylanibacter muris]|uniref:Lipocalin-like domain-containing protein n=1 Tax=Xylanibacter muris TaxID=2736290 RepID=A0ABX2AK25_9BACT|nr:calycin-like domain-containing protein [Xylanibacter muris]NPD91534.1 hypothetical protein [Xylanibacter muris]